MRRANLPAMVPRRRFGNVEAQALRQAGKRTRAGRMYGYGRLGGFSSFGSAPVQPAAWQMSPQALLALAAAASAKPTLGRLGRLAYFRGFGLSPTADVAASAVGSKVAAAGASAAATALGAGAAAGPIGLAAGAVVALALTLFQKQYFNVADANAACATQEQVWQKYASVQGHVAGRALGWTTMIVVWHGAVGEGLFPLNSQHLAFHEGTLNCAGTGAWSDSFLGETLQGTPGSCSQDNCLPNALQKFNPSAVPAGTADAVYFIDNIVLPMNAHDAIPWINNAATNPVVHQLLYDVADAYLAENNIPSTPYVKYPAAATTATTTPAATTAPATPAPAATVAAVAQPAAPQVPSFPGWDTSIAGSDPRLEEAWTETENGYTTLWTPIGNGFFTAAYPNVTSKLQVAISGNSILALRQDSNGGWGKYTGAFDSTGLMPSGTRIYYDSSSPAGSTSNWSASVSSTTPATAAVTATPAVTSVAAAPATTGTTMPTATMAETPAAGTTAAPVNVTVTAAPSAAPSTSSNTLLWVAIAGVGAIVLLTMMQHDDKHRHH